MSLLVNFDPNRPEAKEKSFKSLDIEDKMLIDLQWNFTPDLPALRFQGPQLVFLWDDLSLGFALQDRMGLRMPEDQRIESVSAQTVTHYLPIKNSVDTSSEYKYRLPAMADWRPMVEDFQAASVSGPVLPVAGRVFSVGLKAITTLDNYYCNTLAMHRRKISVMSHTKGSIVQAWTYLTKLTDVCKYDPHKQKHRFSHTFDPQPVETSIVWGERCYSMDRTTNPVVNLDKEQENV